VIDTYKIFAAQRTLLTLIAASARSLSRSASMLVKAGRIAEDAFTPVADGDELPDAPVIVLSSASSRNTIPFWRAGNRSASVWNRANRRKNSAYLSELLLSCCKSRLQGRRAFSAAACAHPLGYGNEIRLTGHFLLTRSRLYPRRRGRLRRGAEYFRGRYPNALHEISDVYQPLNGVRRSTISDAPDHGAPS